MKKWYESKTIWFNLILTVVDIAALLSESVPEPYKAVLLGLHGAGNVVLRVWFTDTMIEV